MSKKILALLVAALMMLGIISAGAEVVDLPRNETLYFAGQQWGTRIDDRGNYGYYRSSTISDYFLNSYSIWLVSWTGMRDSGNSRHTGQSIRPVSE